jgi:hypothetical protein
MANQQTSDNYSGKFPDFVPFLNFVALIQQNSKLSTCREFPSMQRAYTHFWEKALSQYEEEAQRLMRITQGAVEDATILRKKRKSAFKPQTATLMAAGPLLRRHRRRGPVLLIVTVRSGLLRRAWFSG